MVYLPNFNKRFLNDNSIWIGKTRCNGLVEIIIEAAASGFTDSFAAAVVYGVHKVDNRVRKVYQKLILLVNTTYVKYLYLLP